MDGVSMEWGVTLATKNTYQNHPMNAHADTLADRLRAARKEAGLTQEELAEAAHTTQSVIQKIENGHSKRPRRINDIAAVLGVSPGWLLFGAEAEEELDEYAMAVARAVMMLPVEERRHWAETLSRVAAASSSATKKHKRR